MAKRMMFHVPGNSSLPRSNTNLVFGECFAEVQYVYADLLHAGPPQCNIPSPEVDCAFRPGSNILFQNRKVKCSFNRRDAENLDAAHSIPYTGYGETGSGLHLCPSRSFAVKVYRTLLIRCSRYAQRHPASVAAVGLARVRTRTQRRTSHLAVRTDRRSLLRLSAGW